MDVSSEIREVANKYLNKVKPSGPENIMAVCPFHTKGDGRPENTGSFAMSVVTGLWFCHSCHEAGNLHTFLRNIGVSPVTVDRFFKPLLEELNAKHRNGKVDRRCIQIVIDDNPLPDSILGLFEYCPVGLLEEGFTEETLRLFDVGYDQKNDRVTFPIRDLLGHLVGISGRGSSEWGARYKVYAKNEYDAWNIPPRNTQKSDFVWNADRVYPRAYFNSEPIIIPIVEGFKACMWLHQAGFKNTVALMGSWMSAPQKTILERMGGDYYLFLDNDKAGQNAYQFVSRSLASSLSSVRIVQYEGKQPTDLSPTEIQRAIELAPKFHQWALRG